jgi:hypothetical protein
MCSNLFLKFICFLSILIYSPFVLYEIIFEKIKNNKNIAKLFISLLILINYFIISYLFYLYNQYQNTIYLTVFSYLSSSIYFLSSLNLDRNIYFTIKNFSNTIYISTIFSYLLIKFFSTFFFIVNILYLTYYPPKLICYLSLLSIIITFIKVDIFKQICNNIVLNTVYPVEIVITNNQTQNITPISIDTNIFEKYNYKCNLNNIIESSISDKNKCSDDCVECKCLVCLTSMNYTEVYKTKCNHIFHKECMDKWLSQPNNNNTNCILCRQSLI